MGSGRSRFEMRMAVLEAIPILISSKRKPIMGSLMKKSNITHKRMKVILSFLEKKELVTKEPDSTYARKNTFSYHLTDKGKKVVKLWKELEDLVIWLLFKKDCPTITDQKDGG